MNAEEKIEKMDQKLDKVLEILGITQQPVSEFIDLKELCLLLKISKKTAFNFINQNLLTPAHLAGKKKLWFRRDECLKLISNHFVKSYNVSK